MKRIKLTLGAVLAVMAVSLAPAALQVGNTAYAGTPQQEICEGTGGTWTAGNPDATPPTKGSCGNNGAGGTLENRIKDVVNILLFIIGAVAVIMIVVGGIRYTISNGDSNQVTSAKNTILYAVVGLVVAMLAYAIVNFVIGQF